MGAGAPSTEGDGQSLLPTSTPTPPPCYTPAARLLARACPRASLRCSLAVTASAEVETVDSGEKGRDRRGLRHTDACVSFAGGDGVWATHQPCVNPSDERDSCACRDDERNCVVGDFDNYNAACADGYYVSYCGGTRNAELAIMASGSTLNADWRCGCAVEGVPWPVTGVCYAYRYECRPLWGWCEVGYEWDGSKCVDENADEDADKNSPSSAGISTVAIVGIAIGGLVLLSGIGAAVVINIQKSKAAQPPAPAQPTADVAMAAPAVAAPPVATPEIEIERERPKARFDTQTGKPTRFDPQDRQQRTEGARGAGIYPPPVLPVPSYSPL